MKAKPILNKDPEPNADEAIDKEVVPKIRNTLAQRTNTTIRPPSFLQKVSDSKPILDGKLCEEFHCRRGGGHIFQTEALAAKAVAPRNWAL
jgi:hypothetical protein